MRRFAVIGAGTFGSEVAATLFSKNHEVLIIDSDPEKVQDLQRISAKEFKRIDDNKDRGLSLDEYTFGIPSERQDAIDFFTARFQRSDYNGDGKVDFTEDQAYCVDLVTQADANKDGMVSRDEFLSAMSQ